MASRRAKLDIGHIYTNPDPENGQAQYDELPPEALDHLIAAFMHKVGLVRTLAKYNGPEVKNRTRTPSGRSLTLKVSGK
jgi:hypothetical protein